MLSFSPEPPHHTYHARLVDWDTLSDWRVLGLVHFQQTPMGGLGVSYYVEPPPHSIVG